MRAFEGYQRGINLGGWLSQCVSRDKVHFDTFITEKDIQTIADWGLDHVRLPLDYDIVCDEEGNCIEEGFKYIDNCIDWCKKHGLRLILDLHKTKGYMFDEAEVQNPDLFFCDESLQTYFYQLWDVLAKRYGGDYEFVALELLNEVVNPKYTAKWNQIANQTIKRIRAIAPESYLIVGGTCNNGALTVSAIDVDLDDKIIYTFHCYEPMAFTHQKAPWVQGMTDDFDVQYPTSIAELRRKSEVVGKAQVGAIYDSLFDGADGKLFEVLFADALQFAEAKNVPLYCGEYGVLERAPLDGTLNWYREIHDVFEKYAIGRAAWNYKEKDFGIVDTHYSSIQKELVSLL